VAARARLEGIRTVRTYTTLRAVSWYANEMAKTDVRASLNHIVTSMLFDALTIEAYLNHLGSMRFSFWPPLKKKLSPREKLDVICADLAFAPDFGRIPWQTLGDIFELRNLLAHAQTEIFPFKGELRGKDIFVEKWPKSRWEEFMSVGQCQRFLDHTKLMITELASAAGVSPDDVFEKDTMEASIISPEDFEAILAQSA
jgi:hypothetical protein